MREGEKLSDMTDGSTRIITVFERWYAAPDGSVHRELYRIEDGRKVPIRDEKTGFWNMPVVILKWRF